MAATSGNKSCSQTPLPYSVATYQLSPLFCLKNGRSIVVIVISIILAVLISIITLLGYYQKNIKSIHNLKKQLYIQIHSDDPDTRGSAISQLAHNVDLGFRDIRPALYAVRKDPDNLVRQRAALALEMSLWDSQKQEQLEIMTALLHVMQEDTNLETRRMASDIVLDSLRTPIFGKSTDIRDEIIGLSKPYLLKASKDPDSVISENASDALEYLPPINSNSK